MKLLVKTRAGDQKNGESNKSMTSISLIYKENSSIIWHYSFSHIFNILPPWSESDIFCTYIFNKTYMDCLLARDFPS